jgi:predicted nucleic acid-binding protein
MTEKAVIDAQVLFYFHSEYQKIPLILQQLKKKVINGEITVILPTIAIAELFWKMRRAGKTSAFEEALNRWENSENIIIDDFNLEIIKLMLKNAESYELHDEIIAMTCKKHNTDIIYSKDKKFKEMFNLQLRFW